MTLNLLAFDLGAESGRSILGRFDGRRLTLTETHRFANEPVRLPGGLHWDVLSLWREIQHGLERTIAGIDAFPTPSGNMTLLRRAIPPFVRLLAMCYYLPVKLVIPLARLDENR